MPRSLPVVLLVCACWFCPGCPEPVTTTAPARETPFQRLQRERGLLEAGALQAAQGLVDQANLELGQINGKTFLKRAKLDRMVVFVDESAGAETTGADRPVLPDGAVVKRWSDYVSLAHEISASYGKPRIERILRTESFQAPYQAVVSCWVTATYRSGLARRTGPIPEAPKGKKVWKPAWCSGEMGPASLEKLPVPELQGFTGVEPTDDLTRRALKQMRSEPVRSGGQEVTFRLEYRAVTGQWHLSALPEVQAFRDLAEISWYTALPEDPRGILYPGKVDLPDPQESREQLTE
jgi:hypothetical protein